MKRLDRGLTVRDVCAIAMKKYGYPLQPIFLWKLEDDRYRTDGLSTKIFLLSLIYECSISDFYDVKIEKNWINDTE